MGYNLPDGVTDKMIAEYFGESKTACWNCWYYDNGICKRKEEKISPEELEEMEQNDDYSALYTNEDDWCENYEYDDKNEPDYDPFD